MAHPCVFQGCGSSFASFSFPLWEFAARLTRKPLNPQHFNLSLDEQTRMQCSLVKVLLTVSPFGPSFSPQLSVYSQSFSPCSQSRRPPRQLCCLPAFHESRVTNHKPRPAKPLYLPHLRKKTGVRGCFDLQTFRRSDLQTGHDSQVTSFHTTARSLNALAALFATPILCFQQLTRSFAKTPGVGVSRPSDFQTFRPADAFLSPFVFTKSGRRDDWVQPVPAGFVVTALSEMTIASGRQAWRANVR